VLRLCKALIRRHPVVTHSLTLVLGYPNTTCKMNAYVVLCNSATAVGIGQKHTEGTRLSVRVRRHCAAQLAKNNRSRRKRGKKTPPPDPQIQETTAKTAHFSSSKRRKT
jgi:hypothetical protein